MRFRATVFVTSLILVCVSATARAAGPSLSAAITDHFLAKWAEAASSVESIDVRFVRWDINPTFDDKEQSSGRFYWEASGRSYYEFGDELQVVCGEDITVINPRTHEYRQLSSSESSEARAFILSSDSFGLGQILLSIRSLAIAREACQWPEDVLPFYARVDVEALRRDYNLTWGVLDGGVHLVAVSKNGPAAGAPRIELIIDPVSLHVRAHRRLGKHREEVVHVFDGRQDHFALPDREDLLSPDLSRSRKLDELPEFGKD